MGAALSFFPPSQCLITNAWGTRGLRDTRAQTRSPTGTLTPPGALSPQHRISFSVRQQSVTPGRRQRRTRPRAPARFQPGRSGAWNAPLPSIRSRGCTRLGVSNWSCSAVARAAASHELAGSCKQRDPERATEAPCKVARTATHVSATAIMFHVFMMVQHGSWSSAPRARRWPSVSQDDSARAAVACDG